jgi:hypothetical protein
MGWFSNLFGETIEIEFRDEDGCLVRRHVPKKEFNALVDKAVAEGKEF